jgi:cytochrome c oxidase subunit 2
MFYSIAIVVMIFVVIFQIAKASEYVSILKGEQKSRKKYNIINAFLMMAFLILIIFLNTPGFPIYSKIDSLI